MSAALDALLWRHGIDPASVECGADCGDGWLPILDRLLTDLFVMGWNGRLSQVKEKFGLIRVYLDCGTVAQYRRVEQAERESASVCETCGQPGVLRVGGWLQTLCDGHANGRAAWKEPT